MTRIRTIDFPRAGAGAIIARRGGRVMDANEYLLEHMVRARLETDWAAARRAAQVRDARPPRRRPPLRAVLGHALIRLGAALLAESRRRPRHA
jgi:hypothetical protein